jgi:hypothetical protein
MILLSLLEEIFKIKALFYEKIKKNEVFYKYVSWNNI